MDEREFNLFKLLEIIARYFRFIVIFVLIITAVSVVISLLLPRWYKASVLALPPRESTLEVGWNSRLDDIISLTSGLQLPAMATPTDIYARILHSRTLAERVIRSNGLDEYYDIPLSDDLYDKIGKLSDIVVTQEGLLEISYTDKNAQKAASIANSFAAQLDMMVRELASSRARVAREFIETRLVEVEIELDSARNNLQEFQKQHKAVDLDRQTQLAIESAVGLKVSLARDEVELKVKEKSLSATHPDVINLRRRIDEVKSQINTLEFGGADSSYLNLPISEVPSLKIMYAELSSRVQISETLYRILKEQYEQAKIQEKMNTPTVSIIDAAKTPEVPIKPQKRIIVSVTFVLSIILAVFLSLIFNYMEKLRTNSPDDYRRARLFLETVFGWLPGVKKAAKSD
jgi:uncharacterized protein involved in exopolysaccharide biosynthesis